MLYLAAVIAVAMAATRPKGEHGYDTHAAELLTIQNGVMGSRTQPIPGLKLGNLATPSGDTFTFIDCAVTHLSAEICKPLKSLKELTQRSGQAAN